MVQGQCLNDGLPRSYAPEQTFNDAGPKSALEEISIDFLQALFEGPIALEGVWSNAITFGFPSIHELGSVPDPGLTVTDPMSG